MSSRPRRPPPSRRRRSRRSPPARGWRWLLVGPGLLAVGLAVALLVALWVDNHAQTAGEATAAAIEGPLGATKGGVPTSSTLSAYSITYRITEPDTPLQTERKLVQRPFYGRDITYSANGQPSSGAVTGPTGAYLFLTSPKPHWGLLETGTYRATGDDHPGAGLALAVRYHLARVIGTRRLLGRSCTVVRTNGPVGATVAAPTKSDYTDICVDDETGQALDEVWVLNGKLVRERRATAFDTHPDITSSSFTVPSTGPAVPAGTSGSTDVVALTSNDIAQLPVFMPTPSGYRLDGVQDQVSLEDAPGSTEPSQSSEVYAHYVDGPDLIDLEQGAISSPPAGALTVRLADGRRATLTIDLVSSYLDVTVAGQPVRLEGPDVDALMRAAVGIKAQPASQSASPQGSPQG